MHSPDVCIAWLNVHGGSFHKLLRLKDELATAGISCELLISSGPPRGLKVGVDVPMTSLPELAAQGVHFLPRKDVLERSLGLRPRLLITDAHYDPDIPRLIAQARLQGVQTAQMATLLGDFSCYGPDWLLLHHPLTLFFELEYHRTQESRLLTKARGLFFTGNIFFEPTLNTLKGGFTSKEHFCDKYGFDPARPLCLWLPNAADAKDKTYGEVLRVTREAGVELAVKLHPWEYAFKKHGTDPWGLGKTSDEIWGARAVDESDSTWAFHYCDIAVMRTSATSLELPFWKKPGVLLPSNSYPGLVKAQNSMVKSCTVPCATITELAQILAMRPLPQFSDEAYTTARGMVRMDVQQDAYAQTRTAIRKILESPGNGPAIGSLASIRKLYHSYVFPELEASLSPTRRLRYTLARLFDTLRG